MLGDLSATLTARTHAVIMKTASVVIQPSTVLVRAVLTLSTKKNGGILNPKTGGGTTVSVAEKTLYLILGQLNVIQKGTTRAVIMNGVDSVETQQSIVLVTAV